MSWIERPFLLVAKILIAFAIPCLAFGQTPPDIDAITKAAEGGDSGKQEYLGMLYFLGNGVPKNRLLGIKWIEKSAISGGARAQQTAGFLFSLYDEDTLAIYWSLKAARQGEFLAVSRLKQYCIDRKIGPEQCSEVLVLVRDFAGRSDANAIDASCALGDMYSKGVGTFRDPSTAASWYRRCADAGSWSGQLSMAGLYLEGDGVPKDLVLSYMWHNLAASAAPKNDFVDMATGIGKQRDLIALMMTQGQIAEAQKLSRDWNGPNIEALPMPPHKPESPASATP